MLQANADEFFRTVEVTPDKDVRKPTVPESKIQEKGAEEYAPLISFSDDDDQHNMPCSSLQQGVGRLNNSNDEVSNLLDATFQIETIAVLMPTKTYKMDTPSADTQKSPSNQSNADGNASLQMANVDNQNVPKDCVVPLVPAKDCGPLPATHIIVTPANTALAPPQNTKRLKKPKVSFDMMEI